MDDTGETFAALLKRWADAHGWNTNRLRLRLGVSFRLVKRWLDDESLPGPLLIPGLALALELPVEVVESAVKRSVRMTAKRSGQGAA